MTDEAVAPASNVLVTTETIALENIASSVELTAAVTDSAEDGIAEDISDSATLDVASRVDVVTKSRAVLGKTVLSERESGSLDASGPALLSACVGRPPVFAGAGGPTDAFSAAGNEKASDGVSEDGRDCTTGVIDVSIALVVTSGAESDDVAGSTIGSTTLAVESAGRVMSVMPSLVVVESSDTVVVPASTEVGAGMTGMPSDTLERKSDVCEENPVEGEASEYVVMESAGDIELPESTTCGAGVLVGTLPSTVNGRPEVDSVSSSAIAVDTGKSPLVDATRSGRPDVMGSAAEKDAASVTDEVDPPG